MRIMIYILVVFEALVGLNLNGQNLSNAEVTSFTNQIEKNPEPTILESLKNLKELEEMTPYDRARIDLLIIRYYKETHQFTKIVELQDHQKMIDLLENKNYKEAKDYRTMLIVSFVEVRMLSKAIKMLVACEKYAEKYDDQMLTAVIHQHYAHIYYLQGNFDKAFLNLEKAENIYQEHANIRALSGVLNNMAVLYKNRERYNKAIEYNLKALKISQDISDTIAIAESYNNIGRCYHSLYKVENNHTYLQQAIKYFESSAEIKSLFPSLENTAMSNLGQIYDDLSRSDLANGYYKDAIANAERNKSWQYLIGVYENRENAECKKHEFEKAMKFANRRAEILQRLDEINRKNNIEAIEMQKEFYESKEEIAAQKARLYTLLFITIILLLLLTTSILLARQHSHNNKLKLEHKRITLENKVLVSQMNPHFIFNSLTVIQNSLFQNPPLQTAKYISQFAKMIRLTFDMTQREHISLEEEINALNNYVEIQKMRFENRFLFRIDIDSKINVAEYQIPVMLIQPLIENSIEHGLKNISYQGILTLKINKVEKGVLFIVSDNGVGIDNLKLENTKVHALDILKQRLDLINKETYLFQTSRNQSGSGTVTKFILKDA